jgi:hypothetical protein
MVVSQALSRATSLRFRPEAMRKNAASNTATAMTIAPELSWAVPRPPIKPNATRLCEMDRRREAGSMRSRNQTTMPGGDAADVALPLVTIAACFQFASVLESICCGAAGVAFVWYRSQSNAADGHSRRSRVYAGAQRRRMRRRPNTENRAAARGCGDSAAPGRVPIGTDIGAAGGFEPIRGGCGEDRLLSYGACPTDWSGRDFDARAASKSCIAGERL